MPDNVSPNLSLIFANELINFVEPTSKESKLPNSSCKFRLGKDGIFGITLRSSPTTFSILPFKSDVIDASAVKFPNVLVIDSWSLSFTFSILPENCLATSGNSGKPGMPGKPDKPFVANFIPFTISAELSGISGKSILEIPTG